MGKKKKMKLRSLREGERMDLSGYSYSAVECSVSGLRVSLLFYKTTVSYIFYMYFIGEEIEVIKNWLTVTE